ncbi:MAG: AmmeMemoRadiSam system protein B [Candidatus Bilamarchaeaceae archaeon]
MRSAAVAGQFYPDSPEEIREMLSGFFEKAREAKPKAQGKGKVGETGKVKERLRGIIVPHAGWAYSGPVAAIAYKLFAGSIDEFDEALMLGPSHYADFYGLAESGEKEWGTPLGTIKTWSLRERLEGKKDALARQIGVSKEIHAPEHNLEVQVPFFQYLGFKGPICPIVTGRIDEQVGAALVGKGLDGGKTFLLVSSDLSHYLPYTAAKAKDNVTCGAIRRLETNGLDHDCACGLAGIKIAVALAKKKGWRIELLDYRNSGDTAGPKDQVVGYGAFAILE